VIALLFDHLALFFEVFQDIILCAHALTVVATLFWADVVLSFAFFNMTQFVFVPEIFFAKGTFK
jgi:hypothetical protein